MKQVKYFPVFPNKSSWNFSMKKESDLIICNWQMTFQALDVKSRNFLVLLNNDYCSIKPTYMKSGAWLKTFRHLKSLCARATRAITNHVPIGEYQLKFFSKENFNYLCRNYPIELKYHILHECRRYNNYWNPNRELLNHFVAFLEHNSRVFSFYKNIT